MPTIRVASESQCFHTLVTALFGNIHRFHNVKNAFNNASFSKLVDKLFIFYVKKSAAAAVNIDGCNVLFIPLL